MPQTRSDTTYFSQHRPKKRRSRKQGIDGPQAVFNSQFLLDHITETAAAKKTLRWNYLCGLLEDAGFSDRPAKTTFLKWASRGYVPDVWLATVLYAILASGEKIRLTDILTVKDE